MTAPSPDGRARIELLGLFRVRVGGREVAESAWPTRRSAELVQLLALSDRRRLAREQVIEALWPHLDPGAGAANLRKAAHHARQALGRPDAVALRGGQVALFPDCRVEIDVERFERAAAAALGAEDRAACEQALAAYPGVLLPAALYEEWTQVRRDHLRSLHVRLLRLGGHWERLVEVEPADEAAHQELMRGALAAGNRHAALRWYGRLRASLQRELGLPPSRESQALYEECAAGLAAPARAAFTGRHAELARAAAAVCSAERGEAGALLIRGPAGIGKTALCRRVAASAAERGWTVLTTAAAAGSPPYTPLASAVEQALSRDRALLAGMPDRVRATLAALADPAPADPAPAARSLAEPITRHRVIGAVRRVLMTCGEAAGATGVMVILDDAHLADDATVEACSQLAWSGGGLPFLAVLAYRPEAARRALAHGAAGLTRVGRSVGIDLGPLDREDLAALVATAMAPVEPDHETLSEIVEMAQGNPFFAVELARGANGTAGAVAGRTAWDAVAERFLGLEEPSAALLRRLALAGDEIDLGGVLAITGLGERDAFALLDKGLAAGTLAVSGASYRFAHELVRQALIQQVPPHARVVLHRDLARQLAQAGAPPAAIARHWLEGGRPGEAVGWLMAAARQAAGVGAYADALRHLEPVLRHAPRDAQAGRLRAEVLDALGDTRAPQAYAAAADLASGERAGELRAKQALAQLKLGDPGGALRTLDGVSPGTAHGRLCQALALSGAAAIGFGDPDLASAMAEESRRLALQLRDAGALVEASWAQALAAHARGDLRGSLWADLRETSTLPEVAIRVFDGQLCVTQRLLYGAAPYPEVIAFADSLALEAGRLGAARGRGFALTLRGEAELLSGLLDEAEEHLAAAIRLHRAAGAATGEALGLQRLAESALHRGRRDEAAALLRDALAVARESGLGFHLLDRVYGARIAAAPPESALAVVAEAESAIRGPAETCPGCRITLVVPAAIAAARAGDAGRAAGYREAARTLASVVMRLPGWDAAVDEVDGHVALLRGDKAAAAARFRAAAAAFRTCGQPLDARRCAALAAGAG